jgi:hypothetical protein
LRKRCSERIGTSFPRLYRSTAEWGRPAVKLELRGLSAKALLGDERSYIWRFEDGGRCCRARPVS